MPEDEVRDLVEFLPSRHFLGLTVPELTRALTDEPMLKAMISMPGLEDCAVTDEDPRRAYERSKINIGVKIVDRLHELAEAVRQRSTPDFRA